MPIVRLGIVSSCLLSHESQRSSRLAIGWDMSFAARELMEGCGAGLDLDADCDCCDSDSDSDVTDDTSIWLDDDELDASLLDFGEFFWQLGPSLFQLRTKGIVSKSLDRKFTQLR